MKKSIFSVLMGVVFLSLNLSGQVRFKLDIKTIISEKFDLKGVKYGVIQQLEEDGFEISEFGEDYSVWLMDYAEEKTGEDAISYKIHLRVSPPSAASIKPALAEIDLKGDFRTDMVTYQGEDDFLSYLGKLGNYFVSTNRKFVWDSFSDMDKIRAYEVGRNAAKEIAKLVDSISK